MLVYGDPKFSARVDWLFENCRRRIQRTNMAALDEVRSLLIFSGQVEQAIADRPARQACGSELAAASAHLTDCLARFLCCKFTACGRGPEKGILVEALDWIAHIFSTAPALSGEIVTVKIPEGYAFYALFPEQYCAVVLDWAREHSNRQEAFIVGVRSIGTSLSAVIKETLCLQGWQVARITVRPTGHPFDRRLNLETVPTVQDIPVLIVDEGPGLSGSSMAAVAEAFISAGCRNVSFFPGHGNDPGTAATPHIREIWRSVPRRFTPVEGVKWNDVSLEESLLTRTNQNARNEIPCDRIENASGGLWRKFLPIIENEAASPPHFERMKFLCQGPDGNAVLWKFVGLHSNEEGSDVSDSVFGKLSHLALLGYCPAPLDTFRGFVAMPWIQGTRLARADARDIDVLNRIANYICDAAHSPLPSTQNEIAIKRLADMLYSNTKESLGEALAQKTATLADAALGIETTLSYGDGHLAPHEWIHTKRGAILKSDAEGHQEDHTLVGEQSLLWDVAGAFVEWSLDLRTADVLLQAIRARGVRDSEALAFYRAAYAAFRVGLFSHGITQISNEEEKLRLSRARVFYLNQLVAVLNEGEAVLQSAR